MSPYKESVDLSFTASGLSDVFDSIEFIKKSTDDLQKNFDVFSQSSKSVARNFKSLYRDATKLDRVLEHRYKTANTDFADKLFRQQSSFKTPTSAGEFLGAQYGKDSNIKAYVGHAAGRVVNVAGAKRQEGIGEGSKIVRGLTRLFSKNIGTTFNYIKDVLINYVSSAYPMLGLAIKVGSFLAGVMQKLISAILGLDGEIVKYRNQFVSTLASSGNIGDMSKGDYLTGLREQSFNIRTRVIGGEFTNKYTMNEEEGESLFSAIMDIIKDTGKSDIVSSKKTMESFIRYSKIYQKDLSQITKDYSQLFDLSGAKNAEDELHSLMYYSTKSNIKTEDFSSTIISANSSMQRYGSSIKGTSRFLSDLGRKSRSSANALNTFKELQEGYGEDTVVAFMPSLLKDNDFLKSLKGNLEKTTNTDNTVESARSRLVLDSLGNFEGSRNQGSNLDFLRIADYLKGDPIARILSTIKMSQQLGEAYTPVGDLALSVAKAMSVNFKDIEGETELDKLFNFIKSMNDESRKSFLDKFNTQDNTKDPFTEAIAGSVSVQETLDAKILSLTNLLKDEISPFVSSISVSLKQGLTALPVFEVLSDSLKYFKFGLVEINKYISEFIHVMSPSRMFNYFFGNSNIGSPNLPNAEIDVINKIGANTKKETQKPVILQGNVVVNADSLVAAQRGQVLFK